MRSLHSLIDNSCLFLDNTNPPPSLRDILGAYNTKGDGDRDMLIAVLNAKSAEDQRLASVASLQRTVLELVSVYPEPSCSRSHSPPSPPRTRPRRSSSQHKPVPAARPPASTLPPRKRPRPSPSLASTLSSTTPVVPLADPDDREDSPSPPSSSPDKSPSSPPYVWSSQESAEYSPRTRASMAIGSLLSSERDSPTK